MKKSLLMTALGLAILAKFAGPYVSGEHEALAPNNVGFVQSDIGSGEGFGIGGSLDYELGRAFKTAIEGPNSHTDAVPSGNLRPVGDLSMNRLRLNGTYEFGDGGWRLTPYVGVGFGTVDVSESLLGKSAYDRVTAYELRGGVTLGLTQKLLGSLEYRWTNGSKPYLSLAGIPAKLEVDRRGFLVGVNYHF